MKKIVLMLASALSMVGFQALADTTDQRWMAKVELTKREMHRADDSNCFNRYHPDIPSKANAKWVT